jgi:FkbM family methyltransferase
MSAPLRLRTALRDFLMNIPVLRRPSVRYCVSNGLLPSVLCRVSCTELRRQLNLPASEYSAQLNQDIFALLMNRFRKGYFLEIGANDGFTFSNTVYLEEHFGWEGVLVEANPRYQELLAKRENSTIVSKAVTAQAGPIEFVDAGLYGGIKSSIDPRHSRKTTQERSILVDSISLEELLTEVDAPLCIDFLSIDVEGSELDIVDQMASSNRRFRCGCIEHNGRTNDYDAMVSLLDAANYRVIWEDQTSHDLFFLDSEAYGAP